MSEALTVLETQDAEQTATETAAILADYRDTETQALSQDTDAPDAATPQRTGYKRVTAEMAAAIRRLRRLGKTQKETADALGIAQTTVSFWDRALSDDSTEDARQLAKHEALTATMKLAKQIEHSDPRVAQGAAKGIVAIAGVTAEAQVQVGVQVVLGQPGRPAGHDPLAKAHAHSVTP